jgi:hypothetical protein
VIGHCIITANHCCDVIGHFLPLMFPLSVVVMCDVGAVFVSMNSHCCACHYEHHCITMMTSFLVIAMDISITLL